MDTPTITVIIPSYNHSQFITEAIESVVNQTYNNIKLIVIDDGSTDNSIEVIESLQQKYHFHFIKQINMGLPKTLNKFINLCRTQYFCLLASDDSLLDNYIEKQIKVIQEHPEISLLAGKSTTCTPHNKINFYKFNDIFVNRKYSMCAPGMLFRTQIIRDIGGFSEKTKIEDFYILSKLTDLGYTVAENENACGVNYREHENNTHKRHVFMVYEMKKLIDLFTHIDNYDQIKRMWYLNLFSKLCRYNKKEALKFIKFVKGYWYHKKFWHGIKRLIFGSSKD